MSPEDAFQFLNISRKVTPDEIKHAYRITALRCHPDRYYDLYGKQRARVLFAQATDAYRSLVRAGYISPLPPHTQSSITCPSRSMSTPLSNESSETLASFVHLSAASFESHSTASRNMNYGRGCMQGRQSSVETSATQDPNKRARSSPRSSKGNGPTAWRAFSSFLPQRRLGSPGLANGLPGHPYLCSPNDGDYQPDGSPSPNSHLPTSFFPTTSPPYAIPLQSIGLGIGGEWTYSLSLSLEDLFHGRRCRFNISRSYLSQKTKNVVIDIEVPPGCRPGTRIVCRHVGHECRPGVFQDIAFVIEEAKHNRFVRLFDDLIAEVRLQSIRKEGGDVSFLGIDGASLALRIEYPRDKQMKGRSVITGAGMPIRERGRVVGRGNLVVQWEILPHQTKLLHFLKRLIGRK